MVLGQSARAVQQASGEVLWLVLWIVLAAIVLAAGALGLRKWLLRGQDDPAPGFSLRDMQRLHAEGRLSDQEYARAKAAMLARSCAELGVQDDPARPGASGAAPGGEPDDSEDAGPPGEAKK